MKRPLASFAVQVLFWLLAGLGLILLVRTNLPLKAGHLGLLVIGVISFYGQALLFDKILAGASSRRVWLSMMSVGIVTGVANVVLFSAVLSATFGFIWVLAALALELYFSLSGILFAGFRSSFRQRQQQQQLEKEKIELELSLVRSQLNPHFLFNVLNNIDHYVRKDPPKASQSIIQLSSLLRYLLYETAQRSVPLAKEVAFLAEYIDLQKQRVQEGNACTFRQEITDPGLTVVPAIFLPFLENAFSHCPLNQPGNFVYFELIGRPGKITFISRNSRQAALPSEREGLGLALAKKRLALLYPDAHQLHILETEHHFSVELVLYLN